MKQLILACLMALLTTLPLSALRLGSVNPGSLGRTVGKATNATSLTIESGALDARDFAFIADSMTGLGFIDISRVSIAAYNGKRINFSGLMQSAADELPRCAFIAMPSLTTVRLPEGLKSIGQGAFTASGVKDVAIPESVDSIADDAFMRCYRLCEIILPSSLRVLGKRAFANCTKLSSVAFTSGCRLETLSESVFENTMIGFTANFGDLSLCQGIDDYALAHCMNIENVALPPALTHVGEGVVAADSSLSAINAIGLDRVPSTAVGSWVAINPADVTLHAGSDAMARQFADSPGWADFNIEIGLSSLPDGNLDSDSALSVCREGDFIKAESTKPLGAVNVYDASGQKVFTALTDRSRILIPCLSSTRFVIISTAQGVVKFMIN